MDANGYGDNHRDTDNAEESYKHISSLPAGAK